MLARLDEISHFRQFWFVTITPYSTDIEPNVPKVKEVIRSFQELSSRVGKNRIVWRYDPIIINERWPVEKHLVAFKLMAQQLSGYTDTCVISFVDLYHKTKRNFPGIQEIDLETQHHLAQEMVAIASEFQIKIQTCHEGSHLEKYGIEISGCMNQDVLERALGVQLEFGKKTQPRKGCDCLIGSDIGAYNTCVHGCRYCYATKSEAEATKNYQAHDPHSPLLVGNIDSDCKISHVDQKSNIVETLFQPVNFDKFD